MLKLFISLVNDVFKLYQLCCGLMGTFLITAFTHFVYPGSPMKSWSYIFHVVVNLMKRGSSIKPGTPISEVRCRMELVYNHPPKHINLAKKFVPNWCREMAHKLIRHKLISDLGYYPGPKTRDYWTTCPPLDIEFTLPTSEFEPSNQLKTMIFLHGGAHALLSVNSHRPLVCRLSEEASVQGVSINYRLSPENPFPCSLEDLLATYLYLTRFDGMGILPENIVVAGDSSAGGVVAGFLVLLNDLPGICKPGGGLLISPWVDITGSLPSFSKTNDADYLPGVDSFDLSFMNKDELASMKAYDVMTRVVALGCPEIYNEILERGHYYADVKLLSYPLVSALFSDKLHLLPPIMVVNGGCERLLDEGVLLARRIYQANKRHNPHRFNNPECVPPINSFIYEEMPHSFQMIDFNYMSYKASQHCSNFIRQCLTSPNHLKEVAQKFPLIDVTPDDKQLVNGTTPFCWRIDSRLNFLPADNAPEFVALDASDFVSS